MTPIYNHGLFALFFGAGNLIFPPALGQVAGDMVWKSMIGFFITGVGLPLMGVIALARAGGGLEKLTERVNPLFGAGFAVVLYLAIGPFFGIPRTGTVAFEMAALPFLPKKHGRRSFAFLVYSCILWNYVLACA